MLDSDAAVPVGQRVAMRRQRRQLRVGPGIRWSFLRYAAMWGARRSAWAFPGYVGLGAAGLLMVGETASSSGRPGHIGIAGLFAALFAASIVAFWVVALLVSVRTHRMWRALAASAAQLGADFHPFARGWQPGEVLASRGSRGRARSMLVLPDGSRIGEWEYIRPYAPLRANTAHVWSFVSLPAAVEFPHIVLDATANRRWHSLDAGASLSRAQRVRLEGDFDSHFHAYAPAGYGTDALYFLTPDVMADLIDSAADWDLELIGTDAVFFRPGPMMAAGEHALEERMGFLRRWRTRFARWTHWRDDRLGVSPRFSPDGSLRVPPVGVHRDGQRLDDTRGSRALLAYVVALIALPYLVVVWHMLLD
ncbi:hypothetical protein ABXJ56_01245 [Microbacterium chocolatum]|uniref:hypothetical protein n=1 Tax=Microbacterium aurantiacum TaxID=162393 RepID=UPI00338D8E92